jgi:hypothetical protein
MAKLRMYEIEAIVTSIVDKVRNYRQMKWVPPSQDEVTLLRETYNVYRQAEEKYERVRKQLEKKYPGYVVIEHYKGNSINVVEDKTNSVSYKEIEDIRNKIIISQVSGNDVEKLIKSIVKEYTK